MGIYVSIRNMRTLNSHEVQMLVDHTGVYIDSNLPKDWHRSLVQE